MKNTFFLARRPYLLLAEIAVAVTTPANAAAASGVAAGITVTRINNAALVANSAKLRCRCLCMQHYRAVTGNRLKLFGVFPMN